MADQERPKLTMAQQALTWLGTLLVGFGALVLLGAVASIHPLLVRPTLGWILIVVGFALSAGVSVSVVVKASRR